MREPNENVIQMARAKVRESVQALEALLENKSVVHLPVDACFGLIDNERRLIECDWSKTEIYPPEEYRARVGHRDWIMCRAETIVFRLLTIWERFISTNKTTAMHMRCFDVFTIFETN